MSKALYCGSFDPITLGHMDIIKRATKMFDHVQVAVGDNPNKKYMFTHTERVKMVQAAINLLGTNVYVDLATAPILALTADHARIHGFDVIIKGARTNQDFDYEKLIHEVSVTQQRDIETVLLFSSTHLGHVSSSAAKELAKYHGLIHKYVPIHVKAALEAKLGQKIIGVTGTIGSGKSTFCKSVSGVTHVNMDLIGHELLVSPLPIAVETRYKIKNVFGTLDRKELGDIVFGNNERLKELNDIFREPMLTMLREKLVGLKGTILLEGALLAEMDWLFLCNNHVVLTKTPSFDEHNRRLQSRGHTPTQIARRLASQYDYAGKLAVISERLNADQFGKCVVLDSETPDWDSATAGFYTMMKELDNV